MEEVTVHAGLNVLVDVDGNDAIIVW